jgi:hypothetical protein
MGSGVVTGDGDARPRQGNALRFRDEERPASETEGGARIEEVIAFPKVQVGKERELRHLKTASEGLLIEGLHIIDMGGEGKRARIDAAMKEGMERERIVGTGGKGKINCSHDPLQKP